MIYDVNAWLGSWPFRSLRDNTADTLVRRLDRSGIDAAAVSSIDAIFHRNVQSANEALAQAVQPHADRLVPIATINPMYPAWEDDLRVCSEELGMRGTRLFPQYHGYDVAGPEAKRVVTACTERNLPVAIPARVEDIREHHWIDPGKEVPLAGIADLIAAVPGSVVIVPNARGIVGSALWEREDLRDRSWYVDTSLSEFHYTLHYDVDRASPMSGFFESGGAEHLMFGTHLPFSYAGSALVKLETLPLDPDTREQIAWGTAAKVFGTPTD
jgi:uncharacterized protein